jgi:hypothetical protein
MLTAAEVGTIGEQIAATWLKANAWEVYRNTKLPGATDIQASSGSRSLLVQVKTAVFPNLPVFLNNDDKKAIVTRANNNGNEAWLAQLQINDKGALVGKITWTKLN